MDDPSINGFIELLKAAYKERDEARQELQKSVAKVRELQQLLNKISQAAAAKIIPTFSQVQSVVSDYVSETSNSQASSSVESSDRKIRIGAIPVIDTESAIIEELAKGLSLPEKGKLRQAVMNAGPLMATLVQPFPLPTWRNPPGLPAGKFFSGVNCNTGPISR